MAEATASMPGKANVALPTRREWLAFGAVLLAGLTLRVAYLALQGVPIFDPWRHLLLIENLRAGRGFTLFDGQPYIWYPEAWYRICAAVPRWLGPQWLAGLLSWLSVAAFWLWLRRTEAGREERHAAFAGAILAAGFGPLVQFTCHYGSEAFAMFLMLAALALAASMAGVTSAAGAGLLFGVALVARINLAFDAVLFLPSLRTRSRAGAFAAAAAAPLLAAGWRNHEAIVRYAYLFTWDGLATRTSDFDPVSTLVLQMHPAVQEGLRRLHAQIAPVPEWISGPAGIAWGPLLFVIGGTACLLACRRWYLVVASVTTMAYFLLLDRSHSSNFFRIWLGLFPVFFAAAGVVSTRLRHLKGRMGPAASWAVVLALLACGAGSLRPIPMYPIEMVTPPPGLLQESAYLVNSGFYQPESLIWRYPGKRFVGLPLDPEQVDDFRSRFPGFDSVLWHDFSVQDPVLQYLLGPSGGFEIARSGTNPYGRRYLALRPRDAAR